VDAGVHEVDLWGRLGGGHVVGSLSNGPSSNLLVLSRANGVCRLSRGHGLMAGRDGVLSSIDKGIRVGSISHLGIDLGIVIGGAHLIRDLRIQLGLLHALSMLLHLRLLHMRLLLSHRDVGGGRSLGLDELSSGVGPDVVQQIPGARVRSSKVVEAVDQSVIGEELDDAGLLRWRADGHDGGEVCGSLRLGLTGLDEVVDADQRQDDTDTAVGNEAEVFGGDEGRANDDSVATQCLALRSSQESIVEVAELLVPQFITDREISFVFLVSLLNDLSSGHFEILDDVGDGTSHDVDVCGKM